MKERDEVEYDTRKSGKVPRQALNEDLAPDKSTQVLFQDIRELIDHARRQVAV